MLARLATVPALAALTLFTPLIVAVPYDPAPPPPRLAGIAHAAIRVADLNASRAFYRKLGFEEAFAFDKDGVTTQSFIKINDRQFIELYPRLQPADPVGFLHLCFETADIVTLNTFYSGRGLTPSEVHKAGAGNLLFTMEGPEHQNIEYTEYMPGSRHSNDFGQHLGADRISTALVAAALDMQSPPVAKDFYTDKLAFSPGKHLEPDSKSNPAFWLKLPGPSAQSIAFIPHAADSGFQMIFGVDDLKQTAARLQTLNIPSTKSGKTISIHDPDGNTLSFVVPAVSLQPFQ